MNLGKDRGKTKGIGVLTAVQQSCIPLSPGYPADAPDELDVARWEWPWASRFGSVLKGRLEIAERAFWIIGRIDLEGNVVTFF